MRRLLLSLAAAGSLTCQQAAAELQCLGPSDRAAFDVQALRSEAMVLATGCADSAQYNDFMTRYHPALQDNEHEVAAWFQHKFGKRGQAEHDRFITELANAQSDAGTQLGSDFCPHNGVILSEVMALSSASELAQFAAGQKLMPPSADVCNTPAASASGVRRVSVKKHR